MNNSMISALTAIAGSTAIAFLLASAALADGDRSQFPGGLRGAGTRFNKEHVKERASGRDKLPGFVPIDDRNRFPGRRQDGGTLNRNQFPKDVSGCSERVCQ